MTPAARSALFDRTTLVFVALLAAGTALRIWLLRQTPLNLAFDEAQYWAWSRTLDAGYFSKPPLTIWIIAATTRMFGDAEWAVRLAAPIAQSLTALGLYALGRTTFGAWTGFWSGLAWLAMPGIWLSSVIVSTDALLLPFWTATVFALWRLVQTRAWTWAIIAGAAAGLGLMTEYAALYLIAGAAAAAWWSAPVREALRNGRAFAAIGTMLAVSLPNLIWNAQHGFPTVLQTVAEARFDFRFALGELTSFLGDQVLLIGPLTFAAFAILLWRAARQTDVLRLEDRFLLAFALPQLAIVMVSALISHADANWAVAVYPAALVWTVGALAASAGGRRAFAAAMALNLVIGGISVAATLRPGSATQFKGIRAAHAWDETAREIALRTAPARSGRPFSAVLVDDRATYYELNYYWRQARAAGAPLPPLRLWQTAVTQSGAGEPMQRREGGHVLVVHAEASRIPLVAGDFTNFRTVEHLSIPLGGAATRNLDISIGDGYAPVPRDAAFDARLRGDATQ